MNATGSSTAGDDDPGVEAQSEELQARAQRQREKLLAALAARPYNFDFFQAVRSLMGVAHRSTQSDSDAMRPVGHDYAPGSEIVRFRCHSSHSFPPAEITAFDLSPTLADARTPGPAEMTVAFLGLTGPLGALPQHYTQTVLDRLRVKDHTLQNFLDVFNHRTVSFFYRAWEKHRALPLQERAAGERREDSITRALYCLIGLGAPALRGRLEAADEALLFYAGIMAHAPKNAVSLERMLAELFGLPVVLLQFQGQWLLLAASEQSAFPDARRPDGLNCRLGETTIAGERVWSIESKFRLRLGPLGYDAFQALLPGSRLLTQIAQVARTYVGPELEFDAQLVLRREEVPFCQLGPAAGGPRLGWNTWACSVQRTMDADEAVFVSDGRPSR